MKLYGHPIAPTTTMLLFALGEKGCPCELVRVDITRGEQRRPAHLARHPFGVTPVLEEDDGYRIYEARGVLRYLDRRVPEPPLSPADVRDYGRMERLIGVEQSYFSPSVMALYYAQAGIRRADPASLDAARKSLEAPLDVAEESLADGPFLAGESFSLADVAWAPYVAILQAIGEGAIVARRPRLDAWWSAVAARPAWKKIPRV
jgi:glutathione S-transferase